MLVSTAAAGALPSNGHFISGHGTIGKAGQSLTIQQSTTTGIINWNSFSIGKKNDVTFNNGSGATLNRVTGENLSRLAGSLHATGSLYLMNAQGAIVTGTGHIVTGGNFVVSSGALSDGAFLSGERLLSMAQSKIVNRGTIVSGGAAILSGSAVSNTGNIRASTVDISADSGNAYIGGRISATGSAARDGDILIIAQSGKTKVTGALHARNMDGSGGNIETSGHSVSIRGSVDAGVGGQWLIDPKNLKVKAAAAATIATSLNNGTSVTLTTTATTASGPGTKKKGVGNIIIAHGIAWNSSATLELSAFNAIDFEKGITVQGAGNLVLKSDTSGAGGELLNFDGGAVTFSDASGSLTIDGNKYTLISSISEMEAIDDSKIARKGNYALAGSLNLSSVTNWTPLGTDGHGNLLGNGFTGVFEGLGNTVTHLTVKGGENDYMGLFGFLDGTVRDLAITKSNVAGGAAVGGLVGYIAGGELIDDSFSGTVKGSTRTGGLVGYLSAGTIDGSFAAATVTADAAVGDLVGVNFGTVSDSYATGNVTGGKDDGSDIGGLVGTNSGLISTSYATGAVKGSGDVGGLVGGNYAAGSAGQIQNSYATGSVTADAGTTTDIGGLVGLNEQGHISDSYSTGLVSLGSVAGGLVGDNDGGTISSAYWDTTTSQQNVGVGAGNTSGATAETTAQLQQQLPAGFSNDIWAIDPKINGGLPYLIAIK